MLAHTANSSTASWLEFNRHGKDSQFLNAEVKIRGEGREGIFRFPRHTEVGVLWSVSVLKLKRK